MTSRREFLRQAGLAAADLLTKKTQDGREYFDTHPTPPDRRVGIFGSNRKEELEQIAQVVAGQHMTHSIDDMLIEETDPTAPPRPGPGQRKFGFSVDRNKNQLDADRLVGYNSDFQGVFVHLGNNPRLPVENFREGKIPMVFLEFMDYNKDPVNQPEFNYQAFLSGKLDTIVEDLILEAKRYGKPIHFAPWNEMNGNWNPWGLTVNGNSAELHVKAWYRFKQMVDNAGATNIRLTWVVNARSVPDVDSNQFKKAWPGKDAVDVVGTDGFNFRDGGKDLYPGELFTEPITELTGLAGPEVDQMIASTGSKNFEKRDKWAKELLVDLLLQYPQLRAVILFEIGDWKIEGDEKTVAAVSNALKRKDLYDQRRVLRPTRY